MPLFLKTQDPEYQQYQPIVDKIQQAGFAVIECWKLQENPSHALAVLFPFKLTDDYSFPLELYRVLYDADDDWQNLLGRFKKISFALKNFHSSNGFLDKQLLIQHAISLQILARALFERVKVSLQKNMPWFDHYFNHFGGLFQLHMQYGLPKNLIYPAFLEFKDFFGVKKHQEIDFNSPYYQCIRYSVEAQPFILFSEIAKLPPDSIEQFSTGFFTDAQAKRQTIQAKLSVNLKVNVTAGALILLSGIVIALLMSLAAPYLLLIIPAVIGVLSFFALIGSLVWRYQLEGKKCHEQLAEISKNEQLLGNMEKEWFKQSNLMNFFIILLKAYSANFIDFSQLLINALTHFPFLRDAIVVDKHFPLFQPHLANFSQFQQLGIMMGPEKTSDLLFYSIDTFQACVHSAGGFAKFFPQAPFYLRDKIFTKLDQYRPYFFEQTIRCFNDFEILCKQEAIDRGNHQAGHWCMKLINNPEKFKTIITKPDEFNMLCQLLKSDNSTKYSEIFIMDIWRRVIERDNDYFRQLLGFSPEVENNPQYKNNLTDFIQAIPVWLIGFPNHMSILEKFFNDEICFKIIFSDDCGKYFPMLREKFPDYSVLFDQLEILSKPVDAISAEDVDMVWEAILRLKRSFLFAIDEDKDSAGVLFILTGNIILHTLCQLFPLNSHKPIEHLRQSLMMSNPGWTIPWLLALNDRVNVFKWRVNICAEFIDLNTPLSIQGGSENTIISWLVRKEEFTVLTTLLKRFPDQSVCLNDSFPLCKLAAKKQWDLLEALIKRCHQPVNLSDEAKMFCWSLADNAQWELLTLFVTKIPLEKQIEFRVNSQEGARSGFLAFIAKHAQWKLIVELIARCDPLIEFDAALCWALIQGEKWKIFNRLLVRVEKTSLHAMKKRLFEILKSSNEEGKVDMMSFLWQKDKMNELEDGLFLCQLEELIEWQKELAEAIENGSLTYKIYPLLLLVIAKKLFLSVQSSIQQYVNLEANICKDLWETIESITRLLIFEKLNCYVMNDEWLKKQYSESLLKPYSEEEPQKVIDKYMFKAIDKGRTNTLAHLLLDLLPYPALCEQAVSLCKELFSFDSTMVFDRLSFDKQLRFFVFVCLLRSVDKRLCATIWTDAMLLRSKNNTPTIAISPMAAETFTKLKEQLTNQFFNSGNDQSKKDCLMNVLFHEKKLSNADFNSLCEALVKSCQAILAVETDERFSQLPSIDQLKFFVAILMEASGELVEFSTLWANYFVHEKAEISPNEQAVISPSVTDFFAQPETVASPVLPLTVTSATPPTKTSLT